jgi:hypothetical protein
MSIYLTGLKQLIPLKDFPTARCVCGEVLTWPWLNAETNTTTICISCGISYTVDLDGINILVSAKIHE